MRRKHIWTALLLALGSASLQACATTTSTTKPVAGHSSPSGETSAQVPPPAAPVAPVVIQSHPIANIGAWLDGGRDTGAFTTFITAQIGCGDDAQFAEAQVDVQRDARKIVWFANMFSFGPTSRSQGGYALRSDASDCWQELKAQIANHRDRTLAVWLLDEPDSVAWGDQAPSGYDPNLYNDIIATACAMIHADFPTLAIGLNFGNVPAALAPPACLNIVGLEAYGADWLAKLSALEPITSAELWLLPPAYTDAGNATDAEIAERLKAEATYAATDPRVSTLYPFLWCCDDTTTGEKTFYTASGPMLPLTRGGLIAIGNAVRGRQ